MSKLRLFATIFFSFLFLICISWLAVYYVGSFRNLKDLQFLSSTAEQSSCTSSKNFVLVDYEALYKKNNDMVGWIKIDNTPIDLPVMYTPLDGEFYLTHNFDKNENKYGVPFVDERCVVKPRSTNLLLHGHHMADGSMFSSLVEYESEAFYIAHPVIHFDTIYKRENYEIIAAFKSKVYMSNDNVFKYYNFINAKNENEFNYFISNIKNLCTYDIHKTAKFGDELITLSTCSYHTDDGRFAVVAKKING